MLGAEATGDGLERISEATRMLWNCFWDDRLTKSGRHGRLERVGAELVVEQGIEEVKNWSMCEVVYLLTRSSRQSHEILAQSDQSGDIYVSRIGMNNLYYLSSQDTHDRTLSPDEYLYTY